MAIWCVNCGDGAGGRWGELCVGDHRLQGCLHVSTGYSAHAAQPSSAVRRRESRRDEDTAPCFPVIVLSEGHSLYAAD